MPSVACFYLFAFRRKGRIRSRCITLLRPECAYTTLCSCPPPSKSPSMSDGPILFSWWPCRFHPLYSFLFLFPLESSPSSTHSSLLIHAPALTPFLLFFRSSIYSLRFFFYLIQVFPSWFTSLFLFSSSLYACVCYLLNISISLQTSSSSSPFFFTFLCVCVCLPHPISAVCRFRRFALLCSTQRMGCIYHTISSNRKYNSNSDGFPETNSRRAAMLLQLLYRGTYKTVRACTEPCKKKKAGNMCALQCNQ